MSVLPGVSRRAGSLRVFARERVLYHRDTRPVNARSTPHGARPVRHLLVALLREGALLPRLQGPAAHDRAGQPVHQAGGDRSRIARRRSGPQGRRPRDRRVRRHRLSPRGDAPGSTAPAARDAGPGVRPRSADEVRRVARTRRPARRLRGGARESDPPPGDHPLDPPAEALAESPPAAPRRAARASQVQDLSARAAGEPGEAAPVARRAAGRDRADRVPGGGSDDARRYRGGVPPGPSGDRPGIRPRSCPRPPVHMEAPPGAPPWAPPEDPVAFGRTAPRLSAASARGELTRSRRSRRPGAPSSSLLPGSRAPPRGWRPRGPDPILTPVVPCLKCVR